MRSRSGENNRIVVEKNPPQVSALRPEEEKMSLTLVKKLISDLIMEETEEIDAQLSRITEMIPDNWRKEIGGIMKGLFEGFQKTCGRKVKSWWEELTWEKIWDKFDLEEKMEDIKKNLTGKLISLIMPKNITIFTLSLTLINTIGNLALTTILIIQTRNTAKRRKAREMVRNRERGGEQEALTNTEL